MRFHRTVMLCVGCCLVLSGCDLAAIPGEDSERKPVNAGGLGVNLDTSEPVGGSETTPPVQPVQQPPKPTSEVAGVGSGAKGHDDYGGGPIMQPITVPVMSYWGTREKIAYNVQIPHALQLYKAQNGKPPQSTREFMEKIVQPCGVELPDLKPNQRYVFDPDGGQYGQLMVETRR